MHETVAVIVLILNTAKTMSSQFVIRSENMFPSTLQNVTLYYTMHVILNFLSIVKVHAEGLRFCWFAYVLSLLVN